MSAINSNSSLNVQASIVNLGSSSSPDYRLTVQSTQLSDDTVQLNDGTSDLLSAIGPAGSPITYQVDGVATSISSSSPNITLAPGLTVNLVGQSASGTSVSIVVSPSTNSIQSALSSFVNGFNSVVDELDKNVGQTGGALQGNSLVYQLTNSLQSVGNYTTGSGGISSLAALGITFDKTGHVSFDPTVFLCCHGQSDSEPHRFSGGHQHRWIPPVRSEPAQRGA